MLITSCQKSLFLSQPRPLPNTITQNANELERTAQYTYLASPERHAAVRTKNLTRIHYPKAARDTTIHSPHDGKQRNNPAPSTVSMIDAASADSHDGCVSQRKCTLRPKVPIRPRACKSERVELFSGARGGL